jgi:hypothetical protein
MIGNSDSGSNNKKVNSESQELPVDKVIPFSEKCKLSTNDKPNDHVSEELSHLLLNPKW